MTRLIANFSWLACLAVVGCSNPTSNGLGSSCSDQSECNTGLQCFSEVCVEECSSHSQCGDGFKCDQGLCFAVQTNIGDDCVNESDCGVGQTCLPATIDDDSDGWLTASCQLQRVGRSLGAVCQTDEECQQGVCALGQCSPTCGGEEGCSDGYLCSPMAREHMVNYPFAQLCVPADRVVEFSPRVDWPSGQVQIAIPAHAQAFSVVMEADPNLKVGLSEFQTPDPNSTASFGAHSEPTGYKPQWGISTFMFPSNDQAAIQQGVYSLKVFQTLGNGKPAPSAPKVRVLVKLTESAILDLHFVFLNLEEHPCADAWGGEALSSEVAIEGAAFQGMISDIKSIWQQAGVTVGDITYDNILDRPDLDALSIDDVNKLLQLSTYETGITVFVVRSISPVGVQAVAGGRPGPPRSPGRLGSGIVLSGETLCYRDWTASARVLSHMLGQQMGLARNREPSGQFDSIQDSDGSSNNLMFFSDFGGTELSNGQSKVVRGYPGMR